MSANTATCNGHTKSARPTIQSLERGLTLLDYVISKGRPVPLGELAALLSIEKSSVHRLMATLILHGYVVQDAQKKYLSGPAILELASKVSHRLQVQDMAGPYLRALATETGETAHLSVLGRGQAVLTNYVSSSHALAVVSKIGEGEPLHCTALGKALICDCDRQKLEVLLEGKRLKKYTPNTISRIAALIDECNRVRAHSLARDDEEFREGVRCLAAPIRDFSTRIVAAIGISGPVSRLTDKRFKEAGSIVKKTGLEISRKLGSLTGNDRR